ncbi:hypothetical protein ACYSNX_02450 [Myroides sp. LJL115]
MNKIYSIAKAFVFALVAIGVNACQDEPVDPYLKDSDVVGKPVVKVVIEDTEEIFREDIFATVNKKGEFKLIVNDLMQRQDSLQLFTRLFQVGIFPGASNPSLYWNQELDLTYSSVDPKRPGYVTGFVKMEYINKRSHVVNGNFDLMMIPMGNENDSINGGANPSIQSFKISGSFVDLPYKRAEPYYLEAEISEEIFRNNNANLILSENSFIIKAIGVDNPEMEIEITLPSDQIKQGQIYDFSQPGFSAVYFSENGVGYDLGKTNGTFTANSKISIDLLENTQEGNGFLMEGKFTLELHPIEQGKDPLLIEFGRFKLSTQEQ